MNETAITALAREYAEEIVQDTDSYPELPISLLDEMRKEVAEDFEEKIRFLLRRYALVEKEKPKPAEPKFKVGDMVKIKGDGYEPNLHKGDVGEVLDINDKEQCFVLFKKSQAWIYTDCLEPYTEPKEKNHIAQDLEMVDNIIKNGFSKERRLNIAAMLAAGMLANEVRCYPVDRALELADALIAETEKGDSDGED